jgi:hypothetical protein
MCGGGSHGLLSDSGVGGVEGVGGRLFGRANSAPGGKGRAFKPLEDRGLSEFIGAFAGELGSE